MHYVKNMFTLEKTPFVPLGLLLTFICVCYIRELSFLKFEVWNSDDLFGFCTKWIFQLFFRKTVAKIGVLWFSKKDYTYSFIAELSGTYEVLKEGFKYQRNKICFSSVRFCLSKSSVCETGL